MQQMRQTAHKARQGAHILATATHVQRNDALGAIRDALIRDCHAIFAANDLDMADAESAQLEAPLRKRLRFDAHKLGEVADGLEALRGLPDPIGEIQRATQLDVGLDLYRVACPVGVIGVIFESRPDALVQIAALCLKSGNAVLLKGGREALRTNQALFASMDRAAQAAGMPAGWATLLETREDVAAMLKMDDAIDLIIPRGSNAFVRYIMDNSRIPVLGHADGLCTVYIDRAADMDMAAAIAVDSKAQYPAVCNAAETLLIHAEAADALQDIAKALEAVGVTLRGCPRTRERIHCQPATDEDFDTEYLDYMMAVRIVDSLEEAIDHINTHGSGHTDCIVTQDEAAARTFMARVDSAGVYHNCSTRFADGFRYGLGAEVGVATGKIHARGPMGLEGLCTYKYQLMGHGHTVAPYAEGTKHFVHKPLPLDAQASQR